MKPQLLKMLFILMSASLGTLPALAFVDQSMGTAATVFLTDQEEAARALVFAEKPDAKASLGVVRERKVGPDLRSVLDHRRFASRALTVFGGRSDFPVSIAKAGGEREASAAQIIASGFSRTSQLITHLPTYSMLAAILAPIILFGSGFLSRLTR